MSGAVESVFVSYAGADRAWAEWVAWHLREAGRRVLGEDHPGTQEITDNLAQLLITLGRPFEAQKLRASGGKAGQRRARRKRR
ncbi:toll/interleukin-1 receptor domain-containing protein [Streptomyces sp. NPDC006464]|uniref:toll/interleukin-1 receptor domain-containing protein n=1 Tax=Streptomyces sp. NPDC006464 TaxID=3154305 RepID=UPI0033B2BF9B